jgi:peptide chain release factor 2
MSAPGFWNDQQNAQAVVQQVKAVKVLLDPFDAISGRVQSASELEDMLAAEPDDELGKDVERETVALGEELESFGLRSLRCGAD